MNDIPSNACKRKQPHAHHDETANWCKYATLKSLMVIPMDEKPGYKGRINYRVDNTDLFGCLYLLDWTIGMDYWTDLLCPVIGLIHQ